MYKYLLLFFVLTGCSSIPQTTIHKERDLGGVKITWIRDSKTNAIMLDDGLEFSNTCEIHAPEPHFVYDLVNMTALGQQVLRCFYGEFTQNQLKINIKDTEKIQRTLNEETIYISWIRTHPSQEGGPYCQPRSTGSSFVLIGGGVHGCSIRTGAHFCEIYVMEPQSENDELQMSRIGHEILHCFLGDFHN